jgi:hypothetical protein
MKRPEIPYFRKGTGAPGPIRARFSGSTQCLLQPFTDAAHRRDIAKGLETFPAKIQQERGGRGGTKRQG